jgi:hypothetical protein
MHELDRKIKWPKNVGYFSNFHLTAQSKQSPIGRTNLVTLDFDGAAAVEAFTFHK